MGQLDGKVALVTGASRGIGRGIAQRLAGEGARVAVNYARSKDAAESCVAEIKAAGGDAFALAGDVTDIASIEAMFAQLKSLTPHLDILVNNAGGGGGGPVGTVKPEQFDAVYDLNVKGLFFVTNAAVPMLRDYGRIINISSNAAKLRLPGLSIYASSKAAVDSLTRCWSVELAPRQITVNSLNSGMVETDMIAGMDAAFKAQRAASIPMGRIGRVEDIADVVAFLASDQSRWVTGQEISVTGGN